MTKRTKELTHLQNLTGVTLITMPRAGSEYLQSLMDGHPEILVFILNFQFFSAYIKNADTALGDQVNINPSDFIYEFVGKEICRFKGIYHKTERLDRLGPKGADFLDIDLSSFIKSFLYILGEEEASVKNIFLALYGAYHLSVGRDIFKTKVILHHAHWYQEAELFNEVFPRSKMICTVRDPRASIKSMVSNCRDHFYDAYHYASFCEALEVIQCVCTHVYSKRQSYDALPLIFVRLEDLPRKDTLEAILNFIGVKPSSSVFVSTWAGLEWRGDRISGKEFDPTEEWRIDRTYNHWRETLGIADKIILETTFFNFMADNGYTKRTNKTYNYWFNKSVSLLLIFKPLSLEYNFFALSYAIRKIKNNGARGLIHIISTPYYYLRVRCILLMAILR